MKTRQKLRLARLQQIAEVKAGIALGELSALQQKRNALITERERLAAQRTKILLAETEPTDAALLENWLRLSEIQQRDLSIQLAKMQADLQQSTQTARHEEGRRHVLQKLRT